jgi:hypothetical protein
MTDTPKPDGWKLFGSLRNSTMVIGTPYPFTMNPYPMRKKQLIIRYLWKKRLREYTKVIPLRDVVLCGRIHYKIISLKWSGNTLRAKVNIYQIATKFTNNPAWDYFDEALYKSVHDEIFKDWLADSFEREIGKYFGKVISDIKYTMNYCVDQIDAIYYGSQ